MSHSKWLSDNLTELVVALAQAGAALEAQAQNTTNQEVAQ
jgi:hypothetical protein